MQGGRVLGLEGAGGGEGRGEVEGLGGGLRGHWRVVGGVWLVWNRGRRIACKDVPRMSFGSCVYGNPRDEFQRIEQDREGGAVGY